MSRASLPCSLTFDMDDIAFGISALLVGVELMSDLAAAFQALLGEPGQDTAPRERREIPVE